MIQELILCHFCWVRFGRLGTVADIITECVDENFETVGLRFNLFESDGDA